MSQPYTDFLYEHLKGEHELQVERLDKIRERISFISGFLLVLGTAIWSLFNNYTLDSAAHSTRDFVFQFGLVFTVITFVIPTGITSYCLMRGFLYAASKPAQEVIDYAKELEAYNKTPGVTQIQDVEEIIKVWLSETYAKAATYNNIINTRRNILLINAMRLAFASALLAIIPSACLINSKYDIFEKPIQVKIIDSVKIK